jgi:hypothetical protein
MAFGRHIGWDLLSDRVFSLTVKRLFLILPSPKVISHPQIFPRTSLLLKGHGLAFTFQQVKINGPSMILKDNFS